MLVLSRQEGEAIVVPLAGGGTLRLIVVEMRGDNVRLGFEAPDSCKVWRQEVFDQHIAPQLAAAGEITKRDQDSENDLGGVS